MTTFRGKRTFFAIAAIFAVLFNSLSNFAFAVSDTGEGAGSAAVVAEAQKAQPAEAAPVEAAPVETTPVEAAPVEAAPTEPAPVEVQPAVENQPEVVVQPEAAPVAEPVAAPVAEPVAAPVAEPVAAPVAEPVAAPVAEPVAAPVAEPVAVPVAEPVAVPVAEPVAVPVAEPVAAPVAEPVAAPVAEPVAAPVAEPVAVPAQALKTPTPAADTNLLSPLKATCGVAGTPVCGSDPTVTLTCTDPSATQWMCSNTVNCVATISNFDGSQPTQGLEFDVQLNGGVAGPIGNITTTNGFVCTLTNGGTTLHCQGGVVDAGASCSPATIGFPVLLNQCACDVQKVLSLNASVSASNDVNKFNNSVHPTYNYKGVPCGPVCTDPLSLTLGSHTNGQQVGTQTVVISGIVSPASNVSGVTVIYGADMSNGTTVQATVVGNVWFATITLQANGPTKIWVKAVAIDPDCPPAFIDYYTLNYVPVAACTSGLDTLTASNMYSGYTITSDFLFLYGNASPYLNVDNVEVSVNGGAPMPALIYGQGSWSLSLSGIFHTGANTIEVTAYSPDPDCPPKKIKWTIYYQPAAPVCTAPLGWIKILTPPSGMIVNTGTMTVSGQVAGGNYTSGVTVVVNGVAQPATLGQNGNWSATITLQSGSNTVVAIATSVDPLCNNVSDTAKYTYYVLPSSECTAPLSSLNISLPATGSVFNTPLTTVQGTVAPVANVSQVLIRVNGGAWMSVTVDALGAWSRLIGLTSGANVIDVKASSTDVDCSEMTASTTVYYTPTQGDQCTAPVNSVAIVQPVSGTVYASPFISAQGFVVPAANVSQVYVRVNGGTWMLASLNSAGAWSRLVGLASGANLIEVKAVSNDIDCPASVSSVTVYYNPSLDCDECTTPIEWVKFVSPASGTVVTAPSVTVNGMVFPVAHVESLQVSLNGGAWTNLTLSGSWSVTLNGLLSGANKISVRAVPKNATCDVKVDTITVIYTPTTGNQCMAPVTNMQFTSHSDAQLVSGQSVVVSGTVASGALVKHIVVSASVGSPVVATINGNVWSAVVALQSGLNTITATATPVDALCTTVQVTKILKTTTGTDTTCEALIGFEFLAGGQSTTVADAISTYEIRGRVKTGTTVLYGTSVVALDANGNFSMTVTLSHGTNTFTFVAVNGASCTVTKTLTIVRNQNYGGGGGGGYHRYGGGNNYCSDGITRHGEECDDGNITNGDGCSSRCTLEAPKKVGTKFTVRRIRQVPPPIARRPYAPLVLPYMLPRTGADVRFVALPARVAVTASAIVR